MLRQTQGGWGGGTRETQLARVPPPQGGRNDGIYKLGEDYVAWRGDMNRWSFYAALESVRENYCLRETMKQDKTAAGGIRLLPFFSRLPTPP